MNEPARPGLSLALLVAALVGGVWLLAGGVADVAEVSVERDRAEALANRAASTGPAAGTRGADVLPLVLRFEDPRGEPLPDVRVRWIDLDSPEALGWDDARRTGEGAGAFLERRGFAAASDARGRLDLPRIESGALLARSGELSRLYRWAGDPARSEHRVRLLPPRRLEVRVVDAAGRPASGAHVGLFADARAAAPLTVETAVGLHATAAFPSLAHVVRGEGELVVGLAAPGAESTRRPVPLEAPDGALELALPPTGSLVVEVRTLDGAAFPRRARLELGAAPGPGEELVPVASALLLGGRARFAHLPLGTRVAVRLAGAPAGPVAVGPGPASPGEEARLVLRWDATGPRVELRLVDADGAPVRDRVGIYVLERGDARAGGATVRTDRFGRVTLVAPEGEGPWRAHLSFPRLADAPALEATVRSEAAADGSEVVLRPVPPADGR